MHLDSGKGSFEMVTVAETNEPLDVNPVHSVEGTDDETDINFLDDDLSD